MGYGLFKRKWFWKWSVGEKFQFLGQFCVNHFIFPTIKSGLSMALSTWIGNECDRGAIFTDKDKMSNFLCQ